MWSSQLFCRDNGFKEIHEPCLLLSYIVEYVIFVTVIFQLQTKIKNALTCQTKTQGFRVSTINLGHLHG